MKNPLLKTIDIFLNDTNLQEILCFNEFSENIEYYKPPVWDNKTSVGKVLDDQDFTQIRYYLSATHDFEPSKSIVGESCYILAIKKSYHPVKKYIQSIDWDNIPRIDTWLHKTVNCENNAYTRDVSAKMLIAAINRIYNPGCKFDHMIILEGGQGIGKSTLVEILANEWYLDTNFDNKDKDLIDSMRGIFIVEISELSGMNKKDIDWLKSFLSKKVDRVRLPYDKANRDFKRKCIFVGTYNPSGNNMYLRDDTGNRRFWPIECIGKINFQYLRDNLKQIWAEAYHRYKQGEKYFIDNQESLEILSELHSDRELESPTQKTIRKWLINKHEVSMEEIMKDCLKISLDGKEPRMLLSVSTTIGIIMKKLNWKRGVKDKRDIYYAPTTEWE